MTVLLSLLLLIALVGIVLGLIKPGLALPFLAPEKRTRTKAFSLYAALLVFGVFALPAVAPKDDADVYIAQLKKEGKQAEKETVNKNESKSMIEPVKLSVNYKLRPDFRVNVSVTTNLPNDTYLLLTVSDRDVPAGFMGQASGIIKNGSASFVPVGPLPNGNYIAEVLVPVPSAQPKTVQAVIGPQGEHLTGVLVEKGDFGKTVEQDIFFAVEGSTPSPAIIVKSLKKDFTKEYNALLAFKDDHNFWRYGFGQGGKYYDWLKRVQSYDKQYPSQIELKTGLMFANLSILGRTYIRTEGHETQYTQTMRKEIEKALR
ncbi:hypothetical protein [Pseudodesulfovibrio sp.]|uniref:hypothetical protein n=1 Tax=unclassified Pseudodesulfovibrio TaxID=2661612 RepID=UPI003B008346